MTATEMMQRAGKASPRLRAKLVGAYYLVTVVTGAFILFFHGRLAFVADLITALFFVAITAFFYGLSKSGGERKRS